MEDDAGLAGHDRQALQASTSGYESDTGVNSVPSPKLRVGCALLPKKVARYLTPKMIKTASLRGVELCVIDYGRPLLEQGHYDAIVHKLRPNKEWERNLEEYMRYRPDTKVIDRVDGIRTLQNRATMLHPLQGVGISFKQPKGWSSGCRQARVQSPCQVEIPEGMSVSEAQVLLEEAGLMPPLLVKPLWTDGREGSHGLAVLHDMEAFAALLQGSVSSELKPPLVVQQFVEHGGVLYKVYVLGPRTVVCRRPSLGDNYLGADARRKGIMSLPRISCKSTYPKDSPEYQLSCGVVDNSSGGGDSLPDVPPEWVTHALAAALRSKLGLQLFNFDLICPEEQPGLARYASGDAPSTASAPDALAGADECLYYVVDINYFPGVDKIPDFEHIFVDFLAAACVGEGADEGPGSSGQAGSPSTSSDHSILPPAAEA